MNFKLLIRKVNVLCFVLGSRDGTWGDTSSFKVLHTHILKMFFTCGWLEMCWDWGWVGCELFSDMTCRIGCGHNVEILLQRSGFYFASTLALALLIWSLCRCLLLLPCCNAAEILNQNTKYFLNFDNVLLYTWHLLHFCPSWERDPSHVALSEVSTFFLPVKRVF